MSSAIEVTEGQQSDGENAGTSTATEGQSSRATADALNLTTLDKIKRFFFSKEEWEAYLLEKLEQQKSQGEGKNEDQNNYEPLEDPNDKQSVVAWIKTVLPSQEDANSFLKLQLEKLQEVKEDEKDASMDAKQVKEQPTAITTAIQPSKNKKKSKEVKEQKPAPIPATTITTAVQPSLDTKAVERK